MHKKRSKRTNQSIGVGIATWLALTLTIATLCLTMLGYGHDLAYLGAVSLRPEELQRTPLDFLLRSWSPVLDVFTRTDKLSFLKFLTRTWNEFGWLVWAISLAILLLFTLIVSARYHKLWTRWSVMTEIGAKAEKHCTKAWVRICQWCAVSTHQLLFIGGIAWLTLIAGVLAMVLAFYFVLSLVFLALVIFPIAGSESGKVRAQNELLEPLRCLSSKPLAAGLDSGKQARCIRVSRDNLEIARGYLIDYGAGRVFVYDPDTRQPVSVSMDRTVIQQIDALDTSNPAKASSNRP